MHLRQIMALAMLLALCVGSGAVRSCLGPVKAIPADKSGDEGRKSESVGGESGSEWVGDPPDLLATRRVRLHEAELWAHLCRDGDLRRHTALYGAQRSRGPPPSVL